jgi:hypothetical protein
MGAASTSWIFYLKHDKAKGDSIKNFNIYLVLIDILMTKRFLPEPLRPGNTMII